MLKRKNKLMSILLLCSVLFSATACGERLSTILEEVPFNENQGNTMFNLMSFGTFAQDENYIFFSENRVVNNQSKTSLLKADFDGNIIAVLDEIDYNPRSLALHFSFLNVIDGWVYYLNAFEDSVYRIDTNGENRQKISSISAALFFAYQGRLYVHGTKRSHDSNLYVMNLDGSNVELFIEKVGTFYIYNEYIFFTQVTDHNSHPGIYRMNLNGENRTLITERGLDITWNWAWDWIYVRDGYLYHMGERAVLYKTNIESGDTQQVAALQSAVVSELNARGGYLFYLRFTTGWFRTRMYLARISLTTGVETSTRVRVDNWDGLIIGGVFVINNRIIYIANGGMYTIDFDGSNNRRWAG